MPPARSKRCYLTKGLPGEMIERHRKGCRRGRPLCRWMRARNPYRRVCNCPAYPFPHRARGGACGTGGVFGLPGYGLVDPAAPPLSPSVEASDEDSIPF